MIVKLIVDDIKAALINYVKDKLPPNHAVVNIRFIISYRVEDDLTVEITMIENDNENRNNL